MISSDSKSLNERRNMRTASSFWEGSGTPREKTERKNGTRSLNYFRIDEDDTLKGNRKEYQG